MNNCRTINNNNDNNNNNNNNNAKLLLFIFYDMLKQSPTCTWRYCTFLPLLRVRDRFMIRNTA